MSSTRDLHLCGICKKIFNDLNIFLEHKSQCSLPIINKPFVISPNPHDISLESGLFCNETVLDLVLENGSFPLVFHCDNEEVVTDKVQTKPHDGHYEDSLSDLSTGNTHNGPKDSKEINEEDVANLLVTQLSKEVVNESFARPSAERLNGKSSSVSINSEPAMRQENHESDNNENNVKSFPCQKQKNVCKICNFIFAHHRDLVRHMRKHTGEKPYLCSVCDKRFARQDKLLIHKRIHSGDKRYKCQLCKYMTTDSGALRKHLRIHTNERPHKCQICPYRARSSSHMTLHLRTHTGDSPFFCQVEGCGRTFKTSTDLKRHMKVHRADPLNQDYSSRHIREPGDKASCGHFSRKGKLLIKSPTCHVCQDFCASGIVSKKRKSGKKKDTLALCVKQYACRLCGAAFVRQDSLRSHLKLHQQTNPTCVEESKTEESTQQESDPSMRDNTILYLTNSELQESLNSFHQDGGVHCSVGNIFL